MLTTYIKELVALKKYDLAENAIIKGLNKQWGNEWVLLYGMIPSSQPAQALITAERWLKTESTNAVVQLTLGRLCLQNQQWGRAKSFFTKSLELEERPDTHAELAQLHAFLGDKETSEEHYRQGLLLAINGAVANSEFT
jgi:HemY protein